MTGRNMKAIASLGGQSLKAKPAPASCERCGKSFSGKMWHSFLGHLGLHGLADRHFRGDIKAAQRRLQRNGLAKQDPAPWNGAWPKYKPILTPARIVELEEDLSRAGLMLRHGANEAVKQAARQSLELIEIELAELRGH